jgi:hypothetical protein
MTAIKGARGGGAPWVFGIATPFSSSASQGVIPGVNLYQITNNVYEFSNTIHVDQMVNINNTGSESTGNAVLITSLNAASLNAA